MASYDSTSTAGATAAGGASHLGRLKDLDDFKVADGYPDIRGWEVKTSDGQKVGKVGDLIVDTQQMRVRYLDVEIDRSVGQMAQDATTPGDQEAHTLLPIGNVQLDDKHDDVLVNGYTLEQVAGLPRYGGQSITRDYETTLRDRHRSRTGVGGAVAGAAAAADAALSNAGHKVKDALTPDHYDDEDYDDQRLYASRRGARTGAGDAERLTLAEEQLSVGKRQVSGGEVELRKTVETEHVQEQVQLSHEEVTVERRPLAADASTSPTIGEDEIRIPVMEEQLVVQKVMVPREEIIVRKNQVTENQTVEADLRKERLVTEGLDQQQRGAAGGAAGMSGAQGAGAADRATHGGLLDRAADKLDNLKDRVDGNPASKPGPDATDRRI